MGTCPSSEDITVYTLADKSACFWITNSKQNFTESLKECNENNGLFALIGNESINNELLNSNLFSDNLLDRKEFVWIGVSDEATEGSYVSQYGTSVKWTNWANGQPEGQSSPSKDCVAVLPSKRLKWYDRRCSGYHRALCFGNFVQTSTTTLTKPITETSNSRITTTRPLLRETSVTQRTTTTLSPSTTGSVLSRGNSNDSSYISNCQNCSTITNYNITIAAEDSPPLTGGLSTLIPPLSVAAALFVVAILILVLCCVCLRKITKNRRHIKRNSQVAMNENYYNVASPKTVSAEAKPNRLTDFSDQTTGQEVYYNVQSKSYDQSTEESKYSERLHGNSNQSTAYQALNFDYQDLQSEYQELETNAYYSNTEQRREYEDLRRKETLSTGYQELNV